MVCEDVNVLVLLVNAVVENAALKALVNAVRLVISLDRAVAVDDRLPVSVAVATSSASIRAAYVDGITIDMPVRLDPLP